LARAVQSNVVLALEAMEHGGHGYISNSNFMPADVAIAKDQTGTMVDPILPDMKLPK
jgi:hypothetical protein